MIRVTELAVTVDHFTSSVLQLLALLRYYRSGE